ncbi:MAG: alpha/beta hydrolase [Saprospiraceae bacterium]|nr:alpha/beta hydrolase [Saprospiraceae bacterium]
MTLKLGFLRILFFTMTIITMSLNTLVSKDSIPHFYLYSKTTSVDTNRVEAGKCFISGEKLKKEKFDGSLHEWKKALKAEIERLNPDKKGVLVYIHGFMGDNRFFSEESGYVLQKQLFDQENHAYGLVLSLQWEAKLDYPKAKAGALAKGEWFAEVIEEIHKSQSLVFGSPQISFLCHSMGNRVFEGIYQEIVQNHPEFQINQLFLMAADLESDIFDKNFSDIAARSNEVVIFYNSNDRTLAMANAAIQYRRLGVFGPESKHELPSNIFSVNVSDMNDDETFAGKLSLHRYYYGSPSVRRKLLEWMTHTNSAQPTLKLHQTKNRR